MHSSDSEVVLFWLPPGYVYEPSSLCYGCPAYPANDTRFEILMVRYLGDVAGEFSASGGCSPLGFVSLAESRCDFYRILSQYGDANGAPRVSSGWGAFSIDPDPYPHSGTTADPIKDSDIRNEIDRFISNYPDFGPAANRIYFVFTGYSVASCIDDIPGSDGLCSYTQSYCAYHSSYSDSAAPGSKVRYAYLPDIGCPAAGVSPNGDVLADSEISILSHEQFETVSDPDSNGWTDPNGQEMADKCSTNFGHVYPDGHNIVLNGNEYIVQEEWSNAIRGCTLKLGLLFLRTPFPMILHSVASLGSFVYFTNHDPGLAVMKRGSLVNISIPLSGDPLQIAVDTRTSNLYVTNFASDFVWVVNTTTNSVATTVTVSANPYAAAYDPVNQFVYVTNYGNNSVSVISDATNTVNATIPVGQKPDAATFDPANGLVYVANRGSGTLTVIRDTNVVGTVTLSGSQPVGIAYNPTNRDLYVASDRPTTNSSAISVVGPNDTILTSLGLLGQPSAVAYDPANHAIYVTNAFAGGAVTKILGLSVLATYPVSQNATGIAYDKADQYMYVAGDAINGTVVLISPSSA